MIKPTLPIDSWVTDNGRVMPIDTMSEAHVKNCLKMIVNRANTGATWRMEPTGKLVYDANRPHAFVSKKQMDIFTEKAKAEFSEVEDRKATTIYE